jgi:tetratricopeptide (TPR) repeat protein
LDEAITEYRQALRFRPEFAEAHNNLGLALSGQGKPEEEIAEYRAALRIKPDFAEAHNNLGTALCEQGKPDQAVAAYREAIRLKPDDPDTHYGLANALRDHGKVDEAIAKYRETLRIKPDNAEAHCNLGHVLQQQARFAEALAELKRGHEFGSKRPGWRYPSAEWVRQAEWLVEVERKLPSILTGELRPSDASESLAVARMCYDRKLHTASARFWSEAFQLQPKLMEDMQAQYRYNAACAAALAGCGQGKDDPPPDEAAMIRWRKQAIDWLKADLAAWSMNLETGPPQARFAISKTLQHWKADPDLAGLRDRAALDKLPGDEQNAYRALWAEVNALLMKADGQITP